MGLRFRKSFKITSGIKFNVSKTGTSFSLGKKGLSINTGSHGSFLNAGLPGSGISYRKKLFKKRRKQSNKKYQTKNDDILTAYISLGIIIGIITFITYGSFLFSVIAVILSFSICAYAKKKNTEDTAQTNTNWLEPKSYDFSSSDEAEEENLS